MYVSFVAVVVPQQQYGTLAETIEAILSSYQIDASVALP
jgi:hypothetical protein